MKKIGILIGLCVGCSVVHAQSSLTLYGIVGGGFRWVNNTAGGSTVKYTSIIAPNRFGFHGSEDLGNGVSAIFSLENGFSSGTGAFSTSGVLFSRQAYVGLDGTYGRLTFGRQFNAFQDLTIRLDPTEVGGADLAIAPGALLAGNFFTLDTRFNNSAKYRKTFGGATLSASYSFGGAAGNQRAASNYSASAMYRLGTLNGGIGYQRTYNADATQVAQNYYSGGSWQIGPVRLYLSYLALTVSGSAKLPAQRRDSVPQGGIVYQVTPAFVFTAAFYDDIASNLGNVRGASGHKTTAYAIAEYFLSKRTEIYAEFDRNTFTGAYRTDPTNLAVFSRNPTSTGLTGVSVGLSTHF